MIVHKVSKHCEIQNPALTLDCAVKFRFYTFFVFFREGRRQSIRSVQQKSRVGTREGPPAVEEQPESRGQRVTFDESLPKDNLPELLKSQVNLEGQPVRQASILLPGAPVTTPKSTNQASFQSRFKIILKYLKIWYGR